jgi:hypothetical protein
MPRQIRKPPKRYKFLTGYKPNFETIKRAAANDDLALIHCKDKATGKNVAVLAAVAFDGQTYNISPLAKLFDGNPYDELLPPGEWPAERSA